jgi:hypothetical protein
MEIWRATSHAEQPKARLSGRLPREAGTAERRFRFACGKFVTGYCGRNLKSQLAAGFTPLPANLATRGRDCR